jgi:LPXTG-motif cell wall-anchored protein
MLVAPVAVVIEKDPADESKFTVSIDDSAATNITTNDLTVTAQIGNSKGTLLPETGSTGTMLFIALGSIAVIFAGIFLVTNKRMSKEEI